LAALAFASGIWLAGHFQRSPNVWGWAAVALAICAFAALAIKSVRPAQAAAILTLVCAGAFARVGTPVQYVTLPPQEMLNDKHALIIAHVTNDGSFLAGTEARQRVDLETESIELDGFKFTKPVGVRATLYLADDPRHRGTANDLPPLHYGDHVAFEAKLHLPRNFGNPGSFNYEGYLHGLGISALASFSADKIAILRGTTGSRLGFWRSRIRSSILSHIQDSGLWSQEEAALFSAMIVGDDSLLLRNVREEFQQTGVYHLLVISGMNVGILAFAVFWLARRLRLPEWAASLVTIALAVFYAYIANLGVPIMRAVLMLVLFLLARLLYRDRNGLNATGFAALVVLVVSPTALFDAGFQLTFLALLAITGISVPLLDRTSTPYRQALRHLDSSGYDLGIEPKLAQFRLDLRLIAGRLSRLSGKKLARIVVPGSAACALGLYELFLVSTITQAALALPMRAYFHRAAILGLPANMLVLPLAGIMLNCGVAAIALSYVSHPFAKLVAWIAAAALHWTLTCLQFLSQFHISQWRIPDATPSLFLTAVAGMALAFFAVRKRRVIACAGLAVLLLSSFIVVSYQSVPRIESGKLEVTAIDVGQGDSLLVVSPEGRTMLIDGGGSIGRVHGEFDFGEDVVAPYLWWRGIEHLDVVVLTHADSDHIGGLPRIITDFHPNELWLGINPMTQAMEQLYRVAGENHTVIFKHVAGDEIAWGGTKIRVLSPPADWQPQSTKNKNNDSLALLVSYGASSALLAGDMEKKMEKFVATESPAANLLKVAHHGSSSSTTQELLAAVKPQFAVISVGYQNSFGHPRPDVLERLQESKVRTYRTDLFGAVTFLLDGKRVEAEVLQR
jgi:competence protein ComEC